MAKRPRKKRSSCRVRRRCGLTTARTELRFGFEARQSSVGAGASMAAHIALVALFLMIIRLGPQALPTQFQDPETPVDGIPADSRSRWRRRWRRRPKPEPPRKAEVAKKKDPISVPAQKPPDPTPEQPKEPPPQELVVPFKPMSEAEMTLPGVISPSATNDWQGRAMPEPGTGAGSSGRARAWGLGSAVVSVAARIAQAPVLRCPPCYAR